MDERVAESIRKWPDVPAVHGWLRLDARGRWHLVDRNAPGFDPVRDAAGSPITNAQIVEFIDRNYEADPEGRWYWQNGPQRVYVDIERAPLVLRVLEQGRRLVAHTGHEIRQVTGAALGDDGAVYLRTDRGPGVVHDLDLASLSIDEDQVQVLQQCHALEPLGSDVGESLGFEKRPRPD